MVYEYPHNWYIAILAEGENKADLTGTDRQFVCRDLKTLRGVINRYKATLEHFKNGGYEAIRPDLRNFRMEVYNFYDFNNDLSFHIKATVR